jgi:hypothetical protein
MSEELSIFQSRGNNEIISTVQKMFIEQGDMKSIDRLQWQYLGPLGGAYISLAHTASGPSDGAAALYTAFPVQFLVHGQKFLAVQSFDTLTLEKFRGQGLFKILANNLYEAIQEQNVDLVFGIPNDSSVKGFSKYLNWTFIDPLPMLARPVGLRYILVRAKIRTPRLSEARPTRQIPFIEEVESCPDDIDDLFSRVESSNYVGAVRDKEYLDWRLKRPGATYRLFTYRSSTGELLAFGAYELVLKHGCSLGYVMELLQDPLQPHASRSLLRAMTSEMKSRGADLIFAWSMPTSPSRRSFKSNLYFPFPQWIRPIELHLGYRKFSNSISDSDLSRDNWYVSYLDSDTV